MTCGYITGAWAGVELPTGETERIGPHDDEAIVVGRPFNDEIVCATDPFDDFDDDDFDDEFDDDFEEEWDEELPGDADQFGSDDTDADEEAGEDVPLEPEFEDED